MVGHYDAQADIAWLRFDAWDPDRVRVEETSFGLRERDAESGRVLGLKFWEASQRLPQDLLDALPAPPAHDAVIERQPA
jgi:uncharacterized protein YuzE